MSRVERIGLILSGGAPLPDDAVPLDVETPWGDVRVHLAGPDRRLALVSRHGDPHRAPHRVSHRANVEALRRCGARRILALNSVGALRPEMPVPSLVVPHDLLDFSHHGDTTLHEDSLWHADMTEPYCPELREALLAAARATGTPTFAEGVYATTRGPRLETPAEVRALRGMGGDVVGMTGGPEATLAREAGLCYASLCVVVNLGAGLGPKLSQARLLADYRAVAPRVAQEMLRAAASLEVPRACACREGAPPVHP